MPIALAIFLFFGQTQVRPEQIRNPNQIQLYVTPAPGTHINPAQISKPAFVAPAGFFVVGGVDWCDGCTCYQTFYGFQADGGAPIVIPAYECWQPGQ